MKFNRISTAKIQESVDIERLIASQYPDNYLGMQQIQIPQDGGQSIEILKAYLGWEPRKLCFGQIIAILKYKNRLFKVRFHVWREFQPTALANRMTEIEELVSKTRMDDLYLEAIPTDFGHKAFWLNTPDSQLDEESLALRSVSKALKAYSVSKQLCKKLRKKQRKVV